MGSEQAALQDTGEGPRAIVLRIGDGLKGIAAPPWDSGGETHS